MFYDLDWNTNSYSNEFKSHMEVLVQEKNMSWIFVQNPMQMDLVQYKVPHMTFELTRL